MASPFLLVQQVASALVGTESILATSDDTVQCSNATSGTFRSVGGIPTSAGTLNALMSSPMVWNWIRLFLVGGFFECCRRLVLRACYAIYDYCFITAIFLEGDTSYDWMMFWLSQQPSWLNARNVQITTQSFGLKSKAVLIPGEECIDSTAAAGNERRLAYIPSRSSTCTFWFKGRWCCVKRCEKESAVVSKSKEEYLELRILSWKQDILNKMLLEAKRAYRAVQEDSISIYVYNSCWRRVVTRPKRPMDSIVLDPGMKSYLLQDACDFLANRRWYATRGIPFRRGYLLYGAPGSGKTSIIHSLAGELGLDVYIISLSRTGLDDDALSKMISALPEKCMALMEDVDAAFTTSLNRDSKETDGLASLREQNQMHGSRVTLSGLLNAIDGVAAQEGRLLFATTNKYNALDAALIRPGRMDVHIEFKLASKHQARELFRHFYLPEPELEATSENRQEHSLVDWDTDSTTSGNSPLTSTPPSPQLSAFPFDTEMPLSPSTTPGSSPPPESSAGVQPLPQMHLRHLCTSNVSPSEINVLAAEFAKKLPERQLSMADLQGYLMTYKTRPAEAVEEFGTWIKKERREKLEREMEKMKMKVVPEEKDP